MSSNDPKAVVQLTGTDLFTWYSRTGQPIAIDADHIRNSAPPDGTAIAGTRFLYGGRCGFYPSKKASEANSV